MSDFLRDARPQLVVTDEAVDEPDAPETEDVVPDEMLLEDGRLEEPPNEDVTALELELADDEPPAAVPAVKVAVLNVPELEGVDVTVPLLMMKNGEELELDPLELPLVPLVKGLPPKPPEPELAEPDAHVAEIEDPGLVVTLTLLEPPALELEVDTVMLHPRARISVGRSAPSQNDGRCATIEGRFPEMSAVAAAGWSGLQPG